MRTLLTVGLALSLVALSGFSASAGAPAPAPRAVAGGGLFVESAEAASSKVTVSGELRTRWEAVRQNMTDFSSNNHDHNDWVDARMRLGLLFELAAGTEVFIQAQGRYLWGGDSGLNNADGVNDVEDRDSLDVYQAFVRMQPNIFGYKSVLTIGRQEVVLGSEMLLGNDGKYAGLSHDAVRLDLNPMDNLTTTLVVSKVVENSAFFAENSSELTEMPNGGNLGLNDTHLYTLWNTLEMGEDALIDVYVIYLADDDEADKASVFQTIDADAKIWTLGARVKFDRLELLGQKFDFSAEVAAQVGEINPAGEELDIQDSFAFETEAGWSPTFLPWTPRLALGLAWASGDDDPTDGNYNHFQPLAQDRQGRLGKADMFTLENLRCFYVDLSCSPMRDLGVGLAYYKFNAFEESDNGTTGGSVGGAPLGPSNVNDVGDEVDLYASYRLNDNAKLKACWSWLEPDDQVHDTAGMGNSPAHRVHVLLDVKF